MKKIIIILLQLIFFLTLLFYSLLNRFLPFKKKKIIFGTTPIINNKYWSKALRQIGLESETLVSDFYNINKKEDFDIYFEELLPNFIKKTRLSKVFAIFFAWLYLINNAKIIVRSFDSIAFKDLFFWKLEFLLLKINKIKTVIISYGSDSYAYSKLRDLSLQNGLLLSYPNFAVKDKQIQEKILFGTKYADILIPGIMCADGFPRWDVPLVQFVIDTELWQAKNNYNSNDGKNGVVKILHAPNHRGFKGTEFLVNAVEELKKEKLNIELILLENVPNDVIRKVMQEADILADQFIFGYAMNAIEGMASGLPVLSNLEHEIYSMLRRYSYLNECPIVSTTPETIANNLKVLITNPYLREELGKLGRKYVEKYHSYKTFQFLFTNILKKLNGENVDLMNLFHPLKSEYVKKDFIKVPLINNKFFN